MAIFVLLFYALFANVKSDESGSVKNVTSRGSVNVEFGPLWLPRSFKITCCRGGQPVPENPQWIRNWTQTVLDYAIDEHYAEHGATGAGAVSVGETPSENSCRLFQGDYLLSASALFNFNGLQGIGVTCHCPESSRTNHLDRNCRRLAPCLNNGYRSFVMSVACTCDEPYFGEFCEKFCDQGQRMRGADGRDYCGCVPFYQGEECREMVCLNGGTHIKQRCLCPPNFLGYHCEIDTNRTSGASRFQQYGDQELMQGNELFTRDISGTIFSLIMIIVLVVSMYLLMKHRMQVQNRLATLRRDELARPSHGLGARRADLMSPEDARILPFRAAPIIDGGPPPYVPHMSRGRIRRHEHLPPLPSYEDATKLPPLTRPTTVTIQEVQEEEEQHSEDASPQTSTPPPQRRDSEILEAEPSTSTACGPEWNSSIFVVDRPKIDRNTATRKSI